MTDRQARFVELYISGPPPCQFNATRSAEAVGYAWPDKQGPRLMTVPEVARRIKTLFTDRHIRPQGPEILAWYQDWQG
jgi:phage terminase small subunit